MNQPDDALAGPPLLEVAGLQKSFVTRRNLFGRPVSHEHAVRGVSFSLQRGRTLGIVGETGAGKSTVGRLVLRLTEPDSGSVRLLGEDVLASGQRGLRRLRRRAQMIFQDPFASLDPRMVIGTSVGEPLLLHEGLRGARQADRVGELLGRVGLRPEMADRYPHEFSGGQLQRIAIARALATNPDLIICDEPVAALDVSVQAQVLNLLLDLQAERGLGYVFISHDLSLVRSFAHEVAVMNHGEVVEFGPGAELFDNPQHPYTQELVAAIPVTGPGRRRTNAAAAGPPSSPATRPVVPPLLEGQST
ncbi:ATP-binding cassette domain-containing protein [uncultured Modestobacter sp.]|uniref:ATP-binding cassette domain-containing protein n=1 Tax=uncultured Modestobacter sp. TaxID=380048 RepID=UPI00260E9D3F|nr:ATP-binding cassette domain-containing protein [uncultured Modestobacter sp.]